MFSIQKKHKVQVLYKLDTHTAEVLKLRKGKSTTEIIESTTQQIKQITSLTANQETRKTINTYFSEKDPNTEVQELSGLFQKFPHIFHDLIRVVSKYRSFGNGKWSIPGECESNIAEVFLFENRPKDIGTHIHGFIKLICKNNNFITFTERQHSLLDIGYFGFSKIPTKPRKELITRLIETSLVENIPPSKMKKLNFGAIREKICKYLGKIYGIDMSEFEGINDEGTLSEKINKGLGDSHAKTQKIAWKILQAFYSWGAIQEIEEQEKKYKKKEFQDAILGHISKVFPNITYLNSEEIDGTTLHHGTFQFRGKTIEITWRIKSTESILMKTWEDEDYGYLSSLRDRLGISLTFPDDMNSDDIAELMKIGSFLLATNGYILKNKGLISSTELEQIQYESGKSPLFTSTKPGGDPKMQNASQSGFTGIEVGNSTIPIGTEIQYSKKSAMEWKKRENTIYKFRALFNGLLRGEYVDTPQSIYNSIKERMPSEDTIRNLVDPDSKESLGLNSHKDLMKYLIRKNILLPYFGRVQNNDIVLFTTEFHQDNATNEWKIQAVTMNTISGSVHNKLMQFIDDLQ